jgi:hypothetical protein
MKLETLVEYLLNPESLENLFLGMKLDPESAAVLIYMENRLAIDSEIHLFAVEETEDELEFEKEGVTYFQLFPIFHTIKLIKSDLELKDSEIPHIKIAERLLEYRLNDT